MKRILINAAQSEELRVAIVDIESKNLLDLIVERQSHKTKTGNIYLGKISSVEPSLDATFVNFGSERHGFLPLKEIAPEHFQTAETQKAERPNLKEAIREQQTIMVQVEKEERGTKGAALTTFISLAGSYLVLMPNSPNAGGISRRVEGEEREELKEILNNLALPEGMGIIVRTAGVGKTPTELQWDLNTLLKQWEAIKKASQEGEPPFLIHQESDVVVRTIRDYLRQDVTEIWVDDANLFEKVKQHIEHIRPDFLRTVKLYSGSIPLFSRYQIEHQIESAFQREVRLPSGGAIVIDHTEALVAIDVNSARSTKGSDIEETALKTNLEAAEKIACQLRLRDIGGLIVVDFIDMASTRHRREVENHLRNALKLDKARTQVSSISQRFGLLEMSRQRLRPSLGEATQVVCPRCNGWGTIRGVESLALSIIRILEEDAIKPGTAQIQVQLPINIATFIVNEKREQLSQIEKNQGVEIIIVPHPDLDSPRYHIKRVTEQELASKGKARASYQLLESHEVEPSTKKTASSSTAKVEEKPAVSGIFPSEPAPSTKKTTSGLIKRFLSGLFGATEEEQKAATAELQQPQKTPTTRHEPPQRSSNRPPRREEKQRTITPTSTHRTSQETKRPLPPAKPEKSTPDTTETGELKQQRTRRGTRGGRRRTGGRGGNKPSAAPTTTAPTPTPIPTSIQPQSPEVVDKPVTLEEPPPNHLPPFPADLENYYQQTARIKTKKPTQPQKPDTATQIASPTEQPSVAETPEPLPSVRPETPAPSETETAKPIIVRPQPTFEQEKQPEEKPVEQPPQAFLPPKDGDDGGETK